MRKKRREERKEKKFKKTVLMILRDEIYLSEMIYNNLA